MKPRWTEHPLFQGLTRMEANVAGAVAEGWSNPAIAAKFDMSIGTVSGTVHAIYQKAGLTENGHHYNLRARLTNLILRAELVTQTKELT